MSATSNINKINKIPSPKASPAFTIYTQPIQSQNELKAYASKLNLNINDQDIIHLIDKSIREPLPPSITPILIDNQVCYLKDKKVFHQNPWDTVILYEYYNLQAKNMDYNNTSNLDYNIKQQYLQKFNILKNKYETKYNNRKIKFEQEYNSLINKIESDYNKKKIEFNIEYKNQFDLYLIKLKKYYSDKRSIAEDKIIEFTPRDSNDCDEYKFNKINREISTYKYNYDNSFDIEYKCNNKCYYYKNNRYEYYYYNRIFNIKYEYYYNNEYDCFEYNANEKINKSKLKLLNIKSNIRKYSEIDCDMNTSRKSSSEYFKDFRINSRMFKIIQDLKKDELEMRL